MVGIRGGWLSSVAAAAIAGGFADPGICSIDDGSDGASGGGGGAGALDDLFDDDAGSSSGGGDGSGSGDGSGDGGGDGKGSVAEWMKSFSAEAPEGGELSNQEWLAKVGAKDLDDVVKRWRDTTKALRSDGRVKIPGADAKPEEIKAFRESIGAPESVDGYKLELPEGVDATRYEVDGKFLDPLRQVAHEHHIPEAAWKALSEAFMRQQIEDVTAEAASNTEAKNAKVKEWSANAPARKAEFQRGTQILGLTKQDVNAIQAGYGVGRTMDLIAKIGHMGGEDFFADAGAKERFGVASADDAQKAIDAMINDPEISAKIRNKSDKALVDKYNRLCEAKAHFLALDAKNKK